MFPKILDGANVLLYSPMGDYGTINYTTGEICDHIRYYAIAKYPNDSAIYLFGCNSSFEVITDDAWDSIEQCKSIVLNFGHDITWQKI